MKSPAASANLSDLPVLKVLARARAEGRMPHAVLLTGADGTVLARAAEQLAALHLGEEGDRVNVVPCRPPCQRPERGRRGLEHLLPGVGEHDEVPPPRPRPIRPGGRPHQGLERHLLGRLGQGPEVHQLAEARPRRAEEPSQGERVGGPPALRQPPARRPPAARHASER